MEYGHVSPNSVLEVSEQDEKIRNRLIDIENLLEQGINQTDEIRKLDRRIRIQLQEAIDVFNRARPELKSAINKIISNTHSARDKWYELKLLDQQLFTIKGNTLTDESSSHPPTVLSFPRVTFPTSLPLLDDQPSETTPDILKFPPIIPKYTPKPKLTPLDVDIYAPGGNLRSRGVGTFMRIDGNSLAKDEFGNFALEDNNGCKRTFPLLLGFKNIDMQEKPIEFDTSEINNYFFAMEKEGRIEDINLFNKFTLNIYNCVIVVPEQLTDTLYVDYKDKFIGENTYSRPICFAPDGFPPYIYTFKTLHDIFNAGLSRYISNRISRDVSKYTSQTDLLKDMFAMYSFTTDLASIATKYILYTVNSPYTPINSQKNLDLVTLKDIEWYLPLRYCISYMDNYWNVILEDILYVLSQHPVAAPVCTELRMLLQFYKLVERRTSKDNIITLGLDVGDNYEYSSSSSSEGEGEEEQRDKGKKRVYDDISEDLTPLIPEMISLMEQNEQEKQATKRQRLE